MTDTVFETRGHYLFSWTFPQPSAAKAIEQIRFLFSVAVPMPNGRRSYMQHFWFDQTLAPGDEAALVGADYEGRGRYMTWAKGSGILWRQHRMVDADVSVEDLIPTRTSQATLSVSSSKADPFTLASLTVGTGDGMHWLNFKMDQLAATNAQDVPGVVYSGSNAARSDVSKIYLAGDPWRLPTF